MAAAAAVFYGLLEPGDKILLPSDAYFGTRAFAERYLPSFKISIDLCPTKEMGERDLTGYRIVWIETPTNPRLELIDIEKVAGRAHLAGAVVVADNTTMTPIGQQPLDLGSRHRRVVGHQGNQRPLGCRLRSSRRQTPRPGRSGA